METREARAEGNTMREDKSSTDIERQARQAVLVWGAFILVAVTLNLGIPFAFQCDLRTWSYSTDKGILWSILGYAGLFLVLPLVLTKSWATVRQPPFLLPLLAAVVAITLRPFVPAAPALAVVVLAYLHWRFDFSDLGFRSRDLLGDLAAILLLGLMQLVPLLQPGPRSFTPGAALLAGLDRMFANPASTTENLFYFGFLAERLSRKTGRWTAALIGLMYTAHEMSNPEYWYEGQSFVLVFVGVAIFCAVYLWRRNIIAVWLGDGLSRFISRLF